MPSLGWGGAVATPPLPKYGGVSGGFYHFRLGTGKQELWESRSENRNHPKLAEPHQTIEKVEFKHRASVWAGFFNKSALLFLRFAQLIGAERPRDGRDSTPPSPSLPALGSTARPYFHSECALQSSRPARAWNYSCSYQHGACRCIPERN